MMEPVLKCWWYGNKDKFKQFFRPVFEEKRGKERDIGFSRDWGNTVRDTHQCLFGGFLHNVFHNIDGKIVYSIF